MKTLCFLFFSTAALMQVNFVNAQTAGNWNFNNTLAGTAGAHITVSSASFGPSIGSNSFNGEYFGQDGWPTGALDPNAYLQVTLAPSSPYFLSLNSVTLIIRRSTTGTAAGSGPMQWSLRSSLDNYTTNLSTGSLATGYTTFSFSLPAVFQNMTSAVTFRLYGYNSVTTSGGYNRFVYSNISLQGQATSTLLPLENITLAAKTNQTGTIGLSWISTGFDAGTDFSVERSADGTNFTEIYQVQSNSANDAAYQYQDGTASAGASIYYRILAKGPDGGIYQSPVTVVKAGGTNDLQIQGVVASISSLRALMKIPNDGTYRLCVYSMDGKAIFKQEINGQPGSLAMDIPFGENAHGVYILTLSNGGQPVSRKFAF